MNADVHAGCACVLLLLVAAATAGAAQETRAATIAHQQATKAEQLSPYTPSRAERIAADAKRRLFETPNGFYPLFDSVYSGGGLTGGLGYRQFYGDQTFWTARGLVSSKAYKLAELASESIGLAQGALDVRAVGGWRDATQVAFYGVGGDTTPEAKSNFRMQQAYAGVFARARLAGPAMVEAGFQYENFVLQSGSGDSPPIEELYNADTAPGLGANPTYLRMRFRGGVDSRPSAGYARRGGLYALTYDTFDDQDNAYSFDQLQAEVVQHVPVLRENWVFSLHAVAQTTLADSATVPFFLLPALGSGSTLRAYPSWRFRDRHSVLVSGEWRWMPSRLFLDVAVFYDAGKVVSRRDDLNFARLKHDWGVGVRFHSPIATPVRIELARGSEGFNLVFSGAAAF